MPRGFLVKRLHKHSLWVRQGSDEDRSDSSSPDHHHHHSRLISNSVDIKLSNKSVHPLFNVILNNNNEDERDVGKRSRSLYSDQTLSLQNADRDEYYTGVGGISDVPLALTTVNRRGQTTPTPQMSLPSMDRLMVSPSPLVTPSKTASIFSHQTKNSEMAASPASHKKRMAAASLEGIGEPLVKSPKKPKAVRRLHFDEDNSSPVSGTIIRELDSDEEPLVVRKGDIDPSFNVVEVTEEAKAEIAKIDNRIGDYICRLCKEVYDDAFSLAQHRCSRIVHVEYRCPECDKVFNCPANLASHRRWHKPKGNSGGKLSTEKKKKIVYGSPSGDMNESNSSNTSDADVHQYPNSPKRSSASPASSVGSQNYSDDIGTYNPMESATLRVIDRRLTSPLNDDEQHLSQRHQHQSRHDHNGNGHQPSSKATPAKDFHSSVIRKSCHGVFSTSLGPARHAGLFHRTDVNSNGQHVMQSVSNISPTARRS